MLAYQKINFIYRVMYLEDGYERVKNSILFPYKK